MKRKREVIRVANGSIIDRTAASPRFYDWNRGQWYVLSERGPELAKKQGPAPS